ncbi:MAG: Fe-S cluster assembly sulfur transfer protein SufU [Bacteroidota bacterium]
MNSELKKLYTETIKAHNDGPFHFEKIGDAPYTIKAYNPICGDRFEIFVDSSSTKINTLHFHGFGCAISKASTSILTKSIEGKNLREAFDIICKFLRFIDKGLKDNEALSPDFLAFSGVHDFPERYDCATLSWREMKKFLESKITIR